MTWEYDNVMANFLDVCDRAGISYEDALDEEFEGMDPVLLCDLYYGIGYVRGLADAWDKTALEVVNEIITREVKRYELNT